MMQTIYFVRHGHPLSRKGVKYGLDQLGRRQSQLLAERLGKELEKVEVLILHSTTQRCQQTAAIIGKELNCSIQQANLRFGGIDRLPRQLLASKYNYYLQHHRTFDVESPMTYVKRMKHLLRSVLQPTIVIVSHEVNIKVLLNILFGADSAIKIDHASCFRVILNNNAVERMEEIQ